jgi:hypothetical protein
VASSDRPQQGRLGLAESISSCDPAGNGGCRCRSSLGLGVSQRARTCILSYGAEADHVETSPIPKGGIIASAGAETCSSENCRRRRSRRTANHSRNSPGRKREVHFTTKVRLQHLPEADPGSTRRHSISRRCAESRDGPILDVWMLQLPQRAPVRQGARGGEAVATAIAARRMHCP